MELRSPSFDSDSPIPVQYTCDAEDLSPALVWAQVPDGVRSLALIIEDPDAPDPTAPERIWVHWVLYNLDPATGGLPAGLQIGESDGLEGLNDWGTVGYRGPCPPIGRHRYIHRILALDTMLPDLAQPDKVTLTDAMAGHILATAELTGTYQRTADR